MRIKIKIFSSKTSWTPAIPTVADFDVVFPVVEGKKRYDDKAAAKALNLPYITHGGSDNDVVRSVASIFFHGIAMWKEDNSAASPIPNNIKPRILRKLKKDEYSICRIDITPQVLNGKKTAKVRISTNDNYAVQEEHWEKLFAAIAADFFREISGFFTEKGDPPLVFDASVDFYLKVLKNFNTRMKNMDRIKCPHFCDGKGKMPDQCAKSNADCPNYKNGRCVEIPVADI